MNRMLARWTMLACVLWMGQLHAQPSAPAGNAGKLVRFIIPASPGSQGEALTRLVSEKFRDITGHAVVIDNRPGGNGVISTMAALNAPADGTTILMVSSSSMFLTPMTQDVPYQPSELRPLASLSRHTGVLVATPQSGIRQLADVAQAGPAQAPVAVGTYGSLFRVALAVLGERLGLNVVPYPGPMQTLNGTLSGSHPLALVDLGSALPLIRAGRLHAVATTGAQRHAALPEVQTVAEAGFPGFEIRTSLGYGVSAKTLDAVAQALEQALLQSIQDPAFRRAVGGMDGVEITGLPAAQFRQFLDDEKSKLTGYLRVTGGKIPQ
ncbi:tripartite tricarboxylate transporter substrate binding protein [Pseudorhodoferax sp.]|uniref:tripartite tricarboxylate transporter substrate binding protein n=1 Tax=Pseudorhodoferax sp. TaxID=1993553 RepID=UPI002DD69A08|nr:tripartite tricarboxylate transporter substrate binding protein [Pseudorhodoferax sp.]